MSDAARAMSRGEPATPRMESASNDRLARALLLLAREHWVLVDRVALLEAELERRGPPLKLDDAKVDEAMAARLERERDRFLADLLNALAGEG